MSLRESFLRSAGVHPGGPDRPVHARKAVIDTVDGATVTARVGGAPTPVPVTTFAHLTLQPGDVVWVLVQGPVLLVTGRVSDPGGGTGPRGLVARASRTTVTDSTAGDTAVAVLGGVTVPMSTARLYRVSAQVPDVVQSVAGDLFGLLVYEGGSLVQLAHALHQGSTRWSAQPFWVGPGLGGTRSLSCHLRRSSGTGTAYVYAAPGKPALLTVEDLGPA